MTLRMQKINALLKQEISDVILKELDFRKDTMITITGVNTLSDLRQAKVKISVMPFLKADRVLKVLNSQTSNLQKLLNKKLKIKVIPRIKFELDRSGEKTSRIEQLLKKINR